MHNNISIATCLQACKGQRLCFIYCCIFSALHSVRTIGKKSISRVTTLFPTLYVSFHEHRVPPVIILLAAFPLLAGSSALFTLYRNGEGKQILLTAPLNASRSLDGKMDRTHKQINLSHISTSL